MNINKLGKLAVIPAIFSFIMAILGMGYFVCNILNEDASFIYRADSIIWYFFTFSIILFLVGFLTSPNKKSKANVSIILLLIGYGLTLFLSLFRRLVNISYAYSSTLNNTIQVINISISIFTCISWFIFYGHLLRRTSSRGILLPFCILNVISTLFLSISNIILLFSDNIYEIINIHHTLISIWDFFSFCSLIFLGLFFLFFKKYGRQTEKSDV